MMLKSLIRACESARPFRFYFQDMYTKLLLRYARLRGASVTDLLYDWTDVCGIM